MKKLTTARAAKQSTYQTQLRLDGEVPASYEYLKDLITTEIVKQNKEFSREMEKMKQQINTLK